ncbi:MAG: hypothetical protein ACRDSK_21555 [Actinophytocola sp.]|uniref:hypothetical protein n=1 Tax=Actinophytocola sp. TaxID=1872138 RepID=UPI003D6A8739
MSRPGPHQGEPRPYDWQREFQDPDFGQPQRRAQAYPEQSYQQPQYQQPGYSEPQYQQPQYQQPQYQQPGYPEPQYQSYDQQYQSYDQPYQPSAREMYPDEPRRGLRLPGFGLILSLLGIAVQLVCMLVLPWVSASAAGGEELTLPQLWDLATDANLQGFGGWYLVVFSYPLAALGIVLALVSVLESVAGKVIFACIAILGIGYLIVRYGAGPAAGLFGEEKGFSRQEMIAVGIGVGALVIVLIMLKAGLAMFRRIAGLVLLGMAGVHVYALQDLFADGEGLTFGAYGPAVGYGLSGIAALIGPRRLG